MNINVNAIYFSPTGTTGKIVEKIAQSIAAGLNGNDAFNRMDFTLKDARDKTVILNEKDFAIVGVPVYAGRVPNVLLGYLNSIKGNGAIAVGVVLYGNRNYDDALIELTDILKENGFNVAAAGAFIGEHSFSKILAAGRPDEADMDAAGDFAAKICEKILRGDISSEIGIRGNRPYRSYYMPKDKDGNPVDIRKVKPKTNESCIGCKLCADICPMGSIDMENPSQINGICIKCGACIKKCPAGAKYYDDSNYLRHKHELEEEFRDRKAPEIFI